MMIYNFYHITDVHYHSKRNFDCDWRTMPQPNTQICVLKSEEAFKKALEYFEKAYELEPTNDEYKRSLRTMYYRLGMNDKYEALAD